MVEGGSNMTEKEFWQFMEKAWTKGRVSQVSGRIDVDISDTQKVGEYMSGHAMLPKDYDKISKKNLERMASLLFKKEIAKKTKEVVLIILAHQSSVFALNILKKYCISPDSGLEYFADIALSECEMWNE
jgi:hypothetical protein